MCMLCVIPPNVLPSRDKLVNSALNNPHGFGYAIAIPKEQRILTFRTMNADECINKFFEDRAKYPENYAIWHARYATHGSNTIDNCHPFRVGDDEQTYLAHNGILSVIENPKDDRSDTRIFAEDLMPTIGGVSALDNPQVWNMLEDFTTGSKVAFLTVNPTAKHELYLLHEEKGTADSTGVWWSNSSCYLYDYWTSGDYDKKNSYLSAYDYVYSDDDNSWLECKVCEHFIDYPTAEEQRVTEYCYMCGSCYMCEQTKFTCMCYHTSKSYDYRTGTESYHGGGWLSS